MIALVASALVIVLAVAIVRWIVSVPLLRTLSGAIDTWADTVQGHEVAEAEQP